MASVAEELHLSLRREAKRLLEEAAAATQATVRRTLLLRAFALVQQAEFCRDRASQDIPVGIDPFLPGTDIAVAGDLSPPSSCSATPQVIVPEDKSSKLLSRPLAPARRRRPTAN